MATRQIKLIANLDSDQRADKYLTDLFQDQEDLPNLSRSQIQRLIEEQKIKINGERIKPKDQITLGSELEILLDDPTEISLEPENIPLNILFEDEHLIVVNKPPGLTVHPSETQKSGTLVNALLYHIKDLSGIGGKLRPGIVHRIDKDTSGALVVSKSDAAHSGLSLLFAKHDLERKYLSLCYGTPKWREPFHFKSTIGRSDKDRKRMAINVENGRIAISEFSLIESYGLKNKVPFASLIQAKLETGRTHQIRAHLNHLHHSLLGDPVYGTPSENQTKWQALPVEIQKKVLALPGQALHAEVLGFTHPITGKPLRFTAEMPAEFKSLLDALRAFSS